jgi:hypothetical protein
MLASEKTVYFLFGGSSKEWNDVKREQFREYLQMAHFLLLLRGGNADLKSYSPEDLQNLLVRYDVWLDKLRKSKRLLAAQKLKNDDGRLVTTKEDKIAVDDFSSDSKEKVDSYFLVEAADYDGAVAISRQCPVLTHGGSIEIRELAEECATI